MRSGFSIVKNGDSLGYPYLEALRSLAPLVDELVVAHGDSQDSTLESLNALAQEFAAAGMCALRIIDSPWDPNNLGGGNELARQTNIALWHCQHEVCVYVQADEVYPEQDYPVLRRDLARFEQDDEADALAFAWLHFYGNFRTTVHSKRWYRREIRAVKRSRNLQSYGDAQGFRILASGGWAKPVAALSAGRVFHYGWVRPPQVMAKKSEALDRLWHGNARDGTHRAEDMYSPQFGMREFAEPHPAVMNARVRELGDFDPFLKKRVRQDWRYWRLYLSDLLERATGWRPGEFQNYRRLIRYEN